MDDLKARTRECRSCGSPIVWMKTAAGKNMPVDADTVYDPDVEIFDKDVHTSHFATCPDAVRHRRGRE